MPNRRSPFTRRAAAVALATGLLLTACTATVEDDAAPTPTPTASPDASEGSAAPLPEASATPTPTATTTPTPSPEEDVTTPWTRPSAPYGGSRTVPAQSVDTHEASGSSRDNGSGSPSTGDVDPAPEPVPAPEPDTDPELSKTHDDTVEIRSDLGEISFAYDGASSGEDFAYQGQSWDSGDNRLTLDVQGTHDGEDSVASWYNGQTGGAAVHTDIDTNDEPQELHYAFCGTLTFLDYGSASVETCFGQGDSGLENNWWMGGADFGRVGGICHVDADAADSQATSLVACLDSDGLSSNEFEVSMGDAHANYFSLYSLSDLPPLALAPLGTAITNFVDSDPPNLTTAEAIALKAFAAKLADASLELPTSWSVSCDGCAWSITDNQLWAGVHDTTSYPGVAWNTFLHNYEVNNYSVNVTASREASSGVAEWFDGQVGSDGTMIGAGVNQGTTSPGELNFAFCGELAAHGGTLSGSIPLCLGQGSNHDDGESNNWWVGGTGWQAPHVDSDAAVEMLAAAIPGADPEMFLGTEVRMMIHPEHATAVFVLSGTAALGAAVDGFGFVVGLG